MSHRTWSLIASMALLAGCAPGNPGLVVLNVVAPDEQCTYALGNLQLTGGALDVSTGSGYIATLRLGNQLINLGNSGATGVPMADPNIIAVQEVEVELRSTDGTPIAVGGLPNPYTVPAGGGVIPSSDGTTAGEGLASTVLIPAIYTAALAGATGDIIVVVRAVGTTLGGAEVISNEFHYPITLCSGCAGTICAMDVEGNPICDPACNPGQDEPSYVCDPSCTIGS